MEERQWCDTYNCPQDCEDGACAGWYLNAMPGRGIDYRIACPPYMKCVLDGCGFGTFSYATARTWAVNCNQTIPKERVRPWPKALDAVETTATLPASASAETKTMVPTQSAQTSDSTVSLQATTTATSETTAAGPSVRPVRSQTLPKLPTTAIVGIAVGAVIFLLAAVLAMIFWTGRKRKNGKIAPEGPKKGLVSTDSRSPLKLGASDRGHSGVLYTIPTELSTFSPVPATPAVTVQFPQQHLQILATANYAPSVAESTRSRAPSVSSASRASTESSHVVPVEQSSRAQSVSRQSTESNQRLASYPGSSSTSRPSMESTQYIDDRAYGPPPTNPRPGSQQQVRKQRSNTQMQGVRFDLASSQVVPSAQQATSAWMDNMPRETTLERNFPWLNHEAIASIQSGEAPMWDDVNPRGKVASSASSTSGSVGSSKPRKTPSPNFQDRRY